MIQKLTMGMFLLIGGLSAYSLGDYAEGGVVFFLTPDMQHGLVAAITDQDGGNGVVWGDDTSYADASLDGIFFGESYKTTPGSLNTEEILSVYGGVAEAATACNTYSVTVDGVTYHDWFLPTLAELRMVLKRKELIDTTAVANGGTLFIAENYWSSLENLNSSNSAFSLSFNGENPGTNAPDKTTLCRVRAIRSF